MRKMLAVPAVATAMVLGGAAAPAIASTPVHTMTLKVVTTSRINHPGWFVLADRDYRNGKLVGRDVVTCKFSATQHVFNCTVGLALQGGLIAADFQLGRGSFFSGAIVGGTRHYVGIHGLLQGSGSAQGATVTLTYKL